MFCGLCERVRHNLVTKLGFPGSQLSDKEFTCQAGGMDSIPGSERSPGEGNGNPPQYSCLGNPMGRGAWWATTVHNLLDTTQ